MPRHSLSRPGPRLEVLEDRSLPSVTLHFDYSLDRNNFFNTADKRNLLEQAGRMITQQLGDHLAAVTPSGTNTWTPFVTDPTTGTRHSFPNLSVPADTVIIYVGGRDLTGPELGEGGGGGYSASGSQAWLDTVKGRGQAGALAARATDYAPSLGSIVFDTVGANWYFGATTNGLGSNQSDFLSVALHELTHVLGLGNAKSWQTYLSGSSFVGPASKAAYGGPVPLNPGRDHWAEGTRSGGQETVMDPTITEGTRKLMTPLDFAGLKDVGWQVTGATGPRLVWSSWARFDGTYAYQIAMGRNADGRQEQFHIGSDHAVYHAWQTTPNGGWSSWARLAGNVKQIVVTNNPDGRLELFAIGSDNAVWHIWQTTPNGNTWSQWASFGGYARQLALGHTALGRIELYIIGGDNAIWHLWQTSVTQWSGWHSFGGNVRQIAVGFTADGRQELYAIGSDNAVWHLWQKALDGGWTGWYSFGGYARQLAVARNADGRQELFIVGGDNAVWHQWQTAPNGGWSGWYSFGGIATQQIVVAPNADGRLDLFAVGTDGAIYETWQTAPNGNWSAWTRMDGTWARQLAVGRTAEGRLELYHIGSDGAIYHRWQQFI